MCGKFKYITVHFDRTQHGIYVIQISLDLIYKQSPFIPHLKSPVLHRSLQIAIESTLRDVFVYKAGAVTYFFLT